MKCSNLKSVFVVALLITLAPGCSKSDQSNKLNPYKEIEGTFYAVQRYYIQEGIDIRQHYENRYDTTFPEGTVFKTVTYPDFVYADIYGSGGKIYESRSESIGQIQENRRPGNLYYAIDGDSIFYHDGNKSNIYVRIKVTKMDSLYDFYKKEETQLKRKMGFIFTKDPDQYSAIQAMLKAEQPAGIEVLVNGKKQRTLPLLE